VAFVFTHRIFTPQILFSYRNIAFVIIQRFLCNRWPICLRDETLIKTFQKGKWLYFWAVKCPATKAVVGWHLSECRTLCDAKALFWEARRRFPVGYFPKFVRTDSMPAYRFAISKVFNYEVKHEKVISFKHGNNVIENFFRCKRRFPRFRTMESARSYIAHVINEYNSEKLGILEMFIMRLVNATEAKAY